MLTISERISINTCSDDRYRFDSTKSVLTLIMLDFPTPGAPRNTTLTRSRVSAGLSSSFDPLSAFSQVIVSPPLLSKQSRSSSMNHLYNLCLKHLMHEILVIYNRFSADLTIISINIIITLRCLSSISSFRVYNFD